MGKVMPKMAAVILRRCRPLKKDLREFQGSGVIEVSVAIFRLWPFS
jgi:hypothetical protein